MVALAGTGVVQKYRTIKRHSEGEQWDMEVLRLGSSPWNRSAAQLARKPEDEEPHDPRPTVHFAPPAAAPAAPAMSVLPAPIPADPGELERMPAGLREAAARDGPSSMSNVRRDMRKELGATPGCPACARQGQWGHGRHHSAACRIRRAAWGAEQQAARAALNAGATPEEAAARSAAAARDAEQQQRIEIKKEITHTVDAPRPVPMEDEEVLPSGAAASSSGAAAASSQAAVPLGPEIPAPMQDERDLEERASKIARTTSLIADAEEAEIFEVQADPDPVVIQACYCDATGNVLTDDEAAQWDAEEMSKVRKASTFGENMSIEEARASGYKVISTRFVRDQNKRKSRLVVQDIRRGPVSPEHWSPTPNLMTLRLVLLLASLWAFGCTICDISSAFLYAVMPAGSKVAVTLPGKWGVTGQCYPLYKSLYGLRDAPRLWSRHLEGTLRRLGYQQSRLDPSLYFKGKNMIVVHVDDLVIVGSEKARTEAIKELRAEYAMKHEEEVSEPGQQVRLLGRTLIKTKRGFTLVNDATHVQKLAELFELKAGSKGALTPGDKEVEATSEDMALLSPERASLLRSAIGKLMWISADRPDVKFMVSKVACDMAMPTERSWKLAKRLTRYLIEHPMGAIELAPKDGDAHAGIALHCGAQGKCDGDGGWDPANSPGSERRSLKAYVDSDWATDRRDRKSISGGCLFFHGCLLHSWSRKQTTVALSSAEAELGALCTGILEAQQLRHLLAEILEQAESSQPVVNVVVYSDSSAARAIATRTGVSPRVKHLHIKHLHCQGFFEEKNNSLRTVRGSQNPADLLTKPVSLETLQRLRPIVGLTLFGSEPEAKSVHAVAVTGSRHANRRMIARNWARSDIGQTFGRHGARFLIAMLATNMVQEVDGSEQCESIAITVTQKGLTLPQVVLVVLAVVGIVMIIIWMMRRKIVIALGMINVHSAPSKIEMRTVEVQSKPIEMRTVGVQSQTTYTAIRGNSEHPIANPRFYPLSNASHGVFQ
eukprot:6492420-Amphidinium_carterae.1